MGLIKLQEGGCDCPTCGAHFLMSHAFCAIGHARVACVPRVVEYVPAARCAALEAFVRDVAEEPFYGGTPECSDRARALMSTEEGDRA
jgi:hypothetical protein